MKSWQELADAVHAWSLANFRSQSGVGALVPFLGVVEEVGEFYEATTLEEREDAIGDICIFLLDYCKRSGLDLTGVPIRGYLATPIVKWISKLSHARVKRIQGIRGMDNLEAFRTAERDAVIGILSACDNMAEANSLDSAFHIACRTWDNVVSKRKWHTQPDKPITFESACEDFKNVASELNWGLA